MLFGPKVIAFRLSHQLKLNMSNRFKYFVIRNDYHSGKLFGLAHTQFSSEHTAYKNRLIFIRWLCIENAALGLAKGNCCDQD